MKNYANKWIVLGWMLYLISLFIPWTFMPFSGRLTGWAWMAFDFFPFYHLVTFSEAKIEHISSYLLSVSVIIMLASPILLHWLNRTYNTLFAKISLLGFILAFLAFCFEFLLPKQIPPPDSVLGYFIYVSAYALLAIGFVKQASYVQL